MAYYYYNTRKRKGTDDDVGALALRASIPYPILAFHFKSRLWTSLLFNQCQVVQEIRTLECAKRTVLFACCAKHPPFIRRGCGCAKGQKGQLVCLRPFSLYVCVFDCLLGNDVAVTRYSLWHFAWGVVYFIVFAAMSYFNTINHLDICVHTAKCARATTRTHGKCGYDARCSEHGCQIVWPTS